MTSSVPIDSRVVPYGINLYRHIFFLITKIHVVIILVVAVLQTATISVAENIIATVSTVEELVPKG